MDGGSWVRELMKIINISYTQKWLIQGPSPWEQHQSTRKTNSLPTYRVHSCVPGSFANTRIWSCPINRHGHWRDKSCLEITGEVKCLRENTHPCSIHLGGSCPQWIFQFLRNTEFHLKLYCVFSRLCGVSLWCFGFDLLQLQPGSLYHFLFIKQQ